MQYRRSLLRFRVLDYAGSCSDSHASIVGEREERITVFITILLLAKVMKSLYQLRGDGQWMKQVTGPKLGVGKGARCELGDDAEIVSAASQ